MFSRRPESPASALERLASHVTLKGPVSVSARARPHQRALSAAVGPSSVSGCTSSLWQTGGGRLGILSAPLTKPGDNSERMGDRLPGVEVARSEEGAPAPGRWFRERCGATSDDGEEGHQ